MTRPGSRLTIWVAAVVLTTLGAWVSPGTAFACECAGISTARALGQADAVFRGSVVDAHEVGHGGDARTDLRFRVDLVFKGDVYRDQVVATPRRPDGCGLAPRAGEPWLVFARSDVVGSGDDTVGRLVTTLCSGNLPGTATPGVLTGRTPLPGRSDRTEIAVNADRTLSHWLRVGGLAALGVLVVGAAGLGLVWRSRSPDVRG